jgi:hypothetical protein
MNARRLLALLVVFSANAVAQPCATIVQELADDHDCPHCPPEHHAMEHRAMEHHGHGDASAAPPCASLDSDCGQLDEFNIDGRSGQLEVLDGGEQPVLVAFENPQLACNSHTIVPRATGPPFHAAASPPLHLLNCVFLK